MKKISLLLVVAGILVNASAQKTIILTKQQLHNKIKGGWAGQTIGVTFGGPYEFRYNGTFIQDYQPLLWNDSFVKHNMLYNPGLYDDLYMDLTFVDVFEKYGFDAPVDSFANAFANAGYMLWHANQAARYNILNGVKAPQSGHWKYNPHSEDIDYQIESDYAGLMSPGMPNAASAISDKIGHIMNYGDGWYGGVFIGAMYSLAFTSSDMNYIVTEALKTIPKETAFNKCITDVIAWHKKYPQDWHQTWFELQKKWSDDIACADGIFRPFNIDAKINSAYVVMGLLYGNGDFTKTLEIATRAGQDADCNPSSAGGVLGTIMGYDKIPEYWKASLKEAEDIDFKYTTVSLNKVYEIGLKHALRNIEKNGGKVNADKITIVAQAPAAVKLEQGFPKIYPVVDVNFNKPDFKDVSFDFEGTGFILAGSAEKKAEGDADYTFEAEMYIDGKKIETLRFPTNEITRRLELFWQYELPKGKHSVNIKVLNPHSKYALNAYHYIVFSDKPAGSLVKTSN
jgi:hypothetical protein